MANTPKNDGGTAFPLGATHYDGSLEGGGCGMSLRHWFAGMALPALIEKYASIAPVSPKTTAREAFKFADEMLKAGEQ